MITARVLLTELEILLKHNEDDFDRGSGKVILQRFIEENKRKLFDEKYYSMMTSEELIQKVIMQEKREDENDKKISDLSEQIDILNKKLIVVKSKTLLRK